MKPTIMPSMIYGFAADGGFVCGDRATGRTAYAYPTSEYAVSARKSARLAHTAAQEMLDIENLHAEIHDVCERAHPRDAANWEKLGGRL